MKIIYIILVLLIGINGVFSGKCPNENVTLPCRCDDVSCN